MNSMKTRRKNVFCADHTVTPPPGSSVTPSQRHKYLAYPCDIHTPTIFTSLISHHRYSLTFSSSDLRLKNLGQVISTQVTMGSPASEEVHWRTAGRGVVMHVLSVNTLWLPRRRSHCYATAITTRHSVTTPYPQYHHTTQRHYTSLSPTGWTPSPP